MEPPPTNLKVAEQPDSPLTMTIIQMRIDTTPYLSYSVRNNGATSIIGFVVDGMPGTTQRAIALETPLLPGSARSFPIMPTYPQREVIGEYTAKIDFVLRLDGSTWGTSSTGDADFVINFFEGLKRVIADSKGLVANADDAKLTKFINSPPNFPENGGDITKWTRKQEGFMRGYGAALYSFRESVKGRGDLKGIPGRIADLERHLGIDTTAAGNRKRISMSESILEPPIKILGISIGKDPVSIDESFPARPDWLKGLTFRIKNTSGKIINRISFDLDFPETTAMGNRMMWPVSYGPLQFPHTIPARQANETPIAPDATLEITLGETDFAGLKKFLASRQGLDAITSVNIVISSIYYNDGTAWMGGQIMRQDPDNPRTWKPIK